MCKYCSDSDLIRFKIAAIIGLITYFTYTANGRYIGAGDCVPASIIPISLARGNGPWLDRYRAFIEDDQGRLPGYCELSRGHVVSRYPVGPALVLAPLVIPQVYLWDQFDPGWDFDQKKFLHYSRRMSKTAASVLVAVSISLIFFWLSSFVSCQSALLASLAAAFGSGLFPTASQAGWQHGPAVISLMVAITCIHFFSASRFALVLAGTATAMTVVCRLTDVPIAIAVWLYVTRHRFRDLLLFSSAALVIATVWMTWNIYFFDHPNGGYSEIEKMHGWAHGVKGSWATPFFTGLKGTLLSPSHGLLVYSPWVVASLSGLVICWRKTDSDQHNLKLLKYLSLSLLPTLIIYSKYSCWWAGHCFGARFWIDSTPIFASLFALMLESSETRSFKKSAFTRRVSYCLIILSVLIHLTGYLTYPSTWHSSPSNADRDHDRLWDWEDNEISRGLKEGVHARQWNGF